MSRSRDAGTPRKLICVAGSASGVPARGETTTVGAVAACAEAVDATPNAATANAASRPAIVTPVVRTDDTTMIRLDRLDTVAAQPTRSARCAKVMGGELPA